MLNSKEVLSIVGSMFYKYDENDNLITLRVTGMQSSEVIKVIYLNEGSDNTVSKINPNNLLNPESGWIQLKPDGIILFSVVSVADGKGGHMPDVIVTLHKRSDLDSGNSVPYCVCRQNVNDVFYEYQNPNPSVIYAGCCISIDSVPDYIDYKIMTACDGVEYTFGLNVYIEDSLDTILSMVKKAKFDKALDAVYTQYLNAYTQNPLIERVKQLDGISLHGRCKTLRTLLEENNFMYDFNAAFGVFSLGFELDFEDENSSKLSQDSRFAVSQIVRENITDTFVIPYGRDIDKSKIEMKYMLARTPSNRIYIIGYLVDGEFIESPEAMQEIMDKMHGVALMGNGLKYDK